MTSLDATSAAGGMPEDREEDLVVYRDDLNELLAEAEANGVKVTVVKESGFLDPLSISVILLGGSAAVSTVMYWAEQRKGGQVLDLRPTAPKREYRSRDVVFGLVIIITVDGKVTVDVKEPKGAFGIVMAALSQAFAGFG